MSLGVGSSIVTPSHTLRFPFTQKQQNRRVDTIASGWDKVVLREVRAINCVASETRDKAKSGGNFGKVNLNSFKPKGRKKEEAPGCSLLVVFGHSDVSDSCNPWLQPTRLLCPWDSPSKNTGVGCYLLPQRIPPSQGLNLSPAAPASAGRFSTTRTIWEDELGDWG